MIQDPKYNISAAAPCVHPHELNLGGGAMGEAQFNRWTLFFIFLVYICDAAEQEFKLAEIAFCIAAMRCVASAVC
jgi:hypothetical protein